MTIVRTRTPSGEAIVILSEAEFERLRDMAEDGLDARAVDASLARFEAGAEELLNEADLDAIRSAPSPLAFWRARRGIALDALARVCAVEEPTLARIEGGEHTSETGLYDALARALDIDVEDIRPDAV